MLRGGLGLLGALLAVLLVGLGWPGEARAHCDGMDGPVVAAARAALAQRDVNRALIWVKPEADAEVRGAFLKAVSVRRAGGEARDLADLYFYETLVRLHRAGEGAPYTGIKPAGRNLGPAIPAADQALAQGSVEPVVDLVTGNARKGVRGRFEEVLKRRSFASGNVSAGRRYVEAYVDYIHYVEGLYRAGLKAASGHEAEEEEAAAFRLHE